MPARTRTAPPGAPPAKRLDDLQAVLDAVADGILVHDTGGRLLYANEAATRMLGFADVDELRAAGPDLFGRFEVFGGDGRPLAHADMPGRRLLAGEEPEPLLTRSRVIPTGEERWSVVKARGVLGADGGIDYVVNVFTDVTALREREEWRVVFEASPDAMVGASPDGRILLVNAEAEALFGWSREELVGRPADSILAERHRPFVYDVRQRILAGNGSAVVARADLDAICADGREIPVAVALGRIETPGGTLLLGTLRDITERKAAEARVAHLAFHDALTGLPNRALLEQHLERAVSRARRHGGRIALLHVDLDDFKAVNDSLGHVAADGLLCEVGERLRSLTRGADLLARPGGDEFLLFVDDVEDDATALAERIHEALREPFALEQGELRLGATVGLSQFPDDAGDADTLLRHADRAAHAGKDAGRGRTLPYAALAGPAADRLSLTTRLRRAIAENEFVLHWQPIADLATGEVIGTEGLVRWQDPERGLLLPGHFIDAAESLGLIGAIGDRVLDEACRQTVAWDAPYPVGINLSARQVREHDLAERLVARVREAGLEPSRFAIELTESATAEGGEHTLHALNAAGFLVAIDDFGTGYSSLARLAVLPAAALKIDRSFVAALEGSERAQMLVRAILELAASLGLEAVAEGIETPGELEILRALGCPYGQGYLLARPAPAAERPVERVTLP